MGLETAQVALKEREWLSSTLVLLDLVFLVLGHWVSTLELKGG